MRVFAILILQETKLELKNINFCLQMILAALQQFILGNIQLKYTFLFRNSYEKAKISGVPLIAKKGLVQGN